MVRKILSLLVLILFSGFVFSQNYQGNNKIIKKNAEIKVKTLQSMIKFNNKKAQKLVAIEYKFDLKIEREKSQSSNHAVYNIEKLKIKKEKAVRRILSREEFLKYMAIEKQHIKKHKLRS